MTPTQQNFFNTYSPYATQAGSQLGVSPNTILAQWALESNYGTSNVAVSKGNLAGLSPGGTYASYSSPQDFTDAYVGTIQNNFPGAVGSGSNVSAFNAGLQSGPKGSYYTSNPIDYGNNLQTIASLNPAGTTPMASAPGSTQMYQELGPNGQFLGYTEGPQYLQPGNKLGPAVPLGNSGGSSSGGLSMIAPDVAGGSGSLAAGGAAAGSGSGAPLQVGLQPGLASGITDWLSTITGSVGRAFTGAIGSTLTAAENWISRGFLILIGVVILAIGLWQVAGRPDLTKAAAVAAG